MYDAYRSNQIIILSVIAQIDDSLIKKLQATGLISIKFSSFVTIGPRFLLMILLLASCKTKKQNKTSLSRPWHHGTIVVDGRFMESGHVLHPTTRHQITTAVLQHWLYSVVTVASSSSSDHVAVVCPLQLFQEHTYIK